MALDNTEADPRTANCTDLLNDASVIGDLNAPDVKKSLDAILVFGTAAHSKVPGGKEKKSQEPRSGWRQKQMTIRDFLEKRVSKHREADTKDGRNFIFNRSELFPKDTGGSPLVYRHKDRVEAMTSMALDVDGGDTVERVRDKLAELRCLAVVYTTFSHAAKGSPGSDRFRIIVFLKEPFELREDGKVSADRVMAWERKYVGVAELLELGEWDSSGSRTTQLMHAPRRPRGVDVFEHYIIAGTGLDLDTVPDGDPKKYVNKVTRVSADNDTLQEVSKGPAVLSDGFNVQDWFNDIGKDADISLILEDLCWDFRGSDAIRCPNEGAHSDHDEEDTACWLKESENDDRGFVIKCLHDHCDGIYTWDMLRLVEHALDEGAACLPDEYDSLSELLCDPIYYPEIEGEEILPCKYDYGVPRPITRYRRPTDVLKAWDDLGDDVSDDTVANLYACAAAGGNKKTVVDKLEELVKAAGKSANDRKALQKRGRGLYAVWKAQEEDRSGDVIEGTPHPSMAPSAPLGDTMEDALATLAQRYSFVTLDGSNYFLQNMPKGADPRLVLFKKATLKEAHEDRRIPVVKANEIEMVNPVDEYLYVADRWDGIEFQPDLEKHESRLINLFRGFDLEPRQGNYERLRGFIRNIICNGNDVAFRWVWLWLAHLVQRPGEKPGTALVIHGEGGVGKGIFGELVRSLVAPYGVVFTRKEDVVGQFSGPLHTTNLVGVSEEAVFAGNPETVDSLKALVTVNELLVEQKHVQPVRMHTYMRYIFDSNHNRVVQIEGDGSERRYCVLKVSSARRGDREYFGGILDDIRGEALPALLYELAQYRPDTDDFVWGDVREAPETKDRQAMEIQSLRAVHSAVMELIQEGEFVWTEAGSTYRVALKDNDESRIPSRWLDDWAKKNGDVRDAGQRQFSAIFEKLTGLELSKAKARAMVEKQFRDKGDPDEMWVDQAVNLNCYKLPARDEILEKLQGRFGVSFDVVSEDHADN